MPFLTDITAVYDRAPAVEDFEPLYEKIDLVYVLAGRGSALKVPVDNPQVLDPEDDHDRLVHGVNIAKKIYEKTKVRVPIFYNGRTLHNEHLKIALENGLFDYPKELFIICPMPCENTAEQAQAFKRFMSANSYRVVAIVSTAFHLPRVARTFGSNDAAERLILFGIDRERERPGVERDIACELDAMKNYSSQMPPKIHRLVPDNVFLNVAGILSQYSLRLQKQEAQIFDRFIEHEYNENFLRLKLPSL